MEIKERLARFADKFKRNEHVTEEHKEVLIPNQVIRVVRTRIERRYVMVGGMLGLGVAVAGYFIHRFRRGDREP